MARDFRSGRAGNHEGSSVAVVDVHLAPISFAVVFGFQVAEACQRLVNLAIGNGGRDNVTVVLGRYRISGKR